MSNQPTCAICGAAGSGATFSIFSPAVPPFGTVCVECESEAKLSPGQTIGLEALRAIVQPPHDMTCGTCGRTWNDAETPTPSARCPFEYEHGEEAPR